MNEEKINDLLKFEGNLRTKSSTPSHLSDVNMSFQHASIEDRHKRPKPNLETKGLMLHQLEITRKDIISTISLVLHEEELSESYLQYYKKVESLCRYKYIEQSKLSDVLENKIQEYFKNVVVPGLAASLSKESNESIEEYLTFYENWEKKLDILSKIFLYLDRYYLLQHPHKKSILEIGTNLFIDEILIVQDSLLLKHKELLKRVRELEAPMDIELAKRFTKNLIKLNYRNELKLHLDLIHLSSTHYIKLKQTWLKDPETYARIALSKISKEITYFKECGQPKSFLKDLLLRLKWSVFFQNFGLLISKILPFLILDENKKELEILIDYCTTSIEEYNFDSFSIFVYHWGKLISENIDKFIELNKSSTKNFIPDLVRLNNDYKVIAQDKFAKNTKFEFELRNSFMKSLNKMSINNVIMNQLSKYCDSVLKRIGKKLTESEISFEEFKGNVLTIFKAISNKDDFLTLYKRDLSKRLLVNRSISIQHEREVANCFIEVVGELENAIAIQVMFEDLKLSRTKFSHLDFLKDNPIDFKALVLEKKYWPDVPKMDTEVHFPESLGFILDSFTVNYQQLNDRYKDRNLDWTNYTLHQISIEAHFNLGMKELIVNALQAIVILLFNDRDSYNYKEIHSLTNIEESILRRILSALIKFRILIKQDNTYTYNHDFSDKATKIRIPLSRDKDSVGIEEELIRPTQKNRTLEITSIIVKLMKQARSMSYTELLAKLLDILEKRGPITISNIKNEIEKLILDEYLKRLSKDIIVYIP